MRGALTRLGIALGVFFLVWGCSEVDSRDALGVQLYSPSGLGLPNTFPAVAELEVTVFDEELAAISSQRFPAGISGGRHLLSEVTESEAQMMTFQGFDQNGEVVASGGSSFFALDEGIQQLTLFLVETGTFAEAQALFGSSLGVAVTSSPYEGGRGRTGHQAIKLAGGEVLILGGATLTAQGTGLSQSNVAEVHASLVRYSPNQGYFDLVKGALGSTVEMSAPRAYHTATTLPDGRILVVGGLSQTGSALTALRSTELIEELEDGTLVVTPLPPMAVPRYDHTATLRADGTVLIAGGRTLEPDGSEKIHSSAELFVPSQGSFVATQSMNVARAGHTATAIDGINVLIVGGTNGTTVHASTELFTVNTNNQPVFVSTPSMSTARREHSAVVLEQSGGSRFIAVAGGYAGLERESALSTLEILDTEAGLFLTQQNLISARAEGRLLKLEDQELLFVGGVTSDGTRSLSVVDAERLSPLVPDGIEFDVTQMSTSLSAPRFDPEVVRLDNGMFLITGGGRLESGVTTSLATSDFYNPGLPVELR